MQGCEIRRGGGGGVLIYSAGHGADCTMTKQIELLGFGVGHLPMQKKGGMKALSSAE